MSESQNIEWKQFWRDEYLKWIRRHPLQCDRAGVHNHEDHFLYGKAGSFRYDAEHEGDEGTAEEVGNGR